MVLEEMAFHFYAEAKNRSASNLHVLHPPTVQWKMIMLILSGGRFHFFPYCFIGLTFPLGIILSFFGCCWLGGFFVGWLVVLGAGGFNLRLCLNARTMFLSFH